MLNLLCYAFYAVLWSLVLSLRRRDRQAIQEPGIERVQALADISRSALCCHSNETHAPIVNQGNTAQELEGTPYHSHKLHPWLEKSRP